MSPLGGILKTSWGGARELAQPIFDPPLPALREPALGHPAQDRRRVGGRRGDLGERLVDDLVGVDAAPLSVELDHHLAAAIGVALRLLRVESPHLAVRQLVEGAPDLLALGLDDVGRPSHPADRAAPELQPEAVEPRRAEELVARAPQGHLVLGEVAAVGEQQRAHDSTAATRATASSISSGETVSGGSSRTVSGPVALTTSRCSSSRRRARPGPSPLAKASISPAPRTSSPTPRRPMASRSPFSATPRRNRSSSTTSSTVLAADVTSGPPAKVEPWSPGWNSSACSGPATQAPIGRPPPSPFAMVITSGITPACSQAQSEPVRPMPHWISSNTSSAPWRSQASRAAASTSCSTGWMPDSPWMTSQITAAVSSLTAAARAAGSSRGTASKPGTSGAKGACLASCGVADSAPIVRPWKPPSSTTKPPPARWRRHSLSAHSTASAPELQRKTLPPSERSASRCASLMPGSV